MRRVPGVAGVLLEGKTHNADLLAGDRVEECVDDLLGESLLLVVVDVDHVFPVGGDLVQVQLLANVDQVEDVLLKAGAAEPDRGLRFEEGIITNFSDGQNLNINLINISLKF